MQKLTKPQVKGLHILWKRHVHDAHALAEEWGAAPVIPTYLQFRRTAHYVKSLDCVLVPTCGGIVGIEADGYAHM